MLIIDISSLNKYVFCLTKRLKLRYFMINFQQGSPHPGPRGEDALPGAKSDLIKTCRYNGNVAKYISPYLI